MSRVPADQPVVKAMLSARLLDTISNLQQAALLRHHCHRDPAAITQRSGQPYCSNAADENTIFATRTTLVYNAEPILKWHMSLITFKKKLMLERWLNAAQRLRQIPIVHSICKFGRSILRFKCGGLIIEPIKPYPAKSSNRCLTR